MAFKSAVVVTAPDADPEKHRASIKTPMYELTVVVVKHGNLDQAVEVCQELVRNEGVQSFILCPGFSHQGVARIASALGKEVAVNVARGDTRSTVVTSKVLKEEGWI
jgi:hypothetical protein